MKTSEDEIVPIGTSPRMQTTSPAPPKKKNQIVPIEMNPIRPTSSQSVRNFTNAELFSIGSRAETNLSSNAVENWEKPEWLPDELNEKLKKGIELEAEEITPEPLNQIVLSKNEREYIPYDIAKGHIEKIVKKLAAQHGNYVLTVKNLEDKYRKIELEANGHFSAFVTQIRSQYAVKPGHH